MDGDTTDENTSSHQLEQRPFANRDNPKIQKSQSKQSSQKALANRALPLQRQASSSTVSKTGATGAQKASEKSRITFLEQRNRHLELELKRH